MGNSSQFYKILFFTFCFLALFLYSQPAHAFLSVIPELASMQLGALDFLDSVFAWIFFLLLIALAGSFFIVFSANFLDWASSIPVNLNNDLVDTGWRFLSGFSNIIFILIFIAIALFYIFKIESWGMKKALVPLIVIAFLMNFSLLFVKMFVDIGWIMQNSIKISLFGESGIAAPIAVQVSQSITAIALAYSSQFFTPFFIISSLPFVSALKSIIFATTLLMGGMIGSLSQVFILISFSVIGGFIFLVYGVLFLLRIVAIWILAIASPLALVAYILPQTRKFFSQWLQALFQWTFFGVVIFFLMGLGLKFFHAVAPAHIFENVLGVNLVASYSKFIFLLIYLFFALTVAKKFTPAAGQFIWKAMERGGLAAGVVGAAVAARGASTAAKTVKSAATSFREAKGMGWSTRQALGESAREIKRGIAPPRPPGAPEATWGEAARATAKGIFGAVGNTAKAGVMAGLGIKLKKIGLRKKPCEACGFGGRPGEKIAASATECPRCKNVF